MHKRLGAVQNFTLSATSQLASAFGPQTYRVRVAVTVAPSTAVSTQGGAYILIGDSTGITASSTNGSLIPSPWAEDFIVTPGQRMALIEASTSHGTISITEYA